MSKIPPSDTFSNLAESTRQWIETIEEPSTSRKLSPPWGWIVYVLRHGITFFRITVREFLDDHLLLKSAALTFATLLTIIPVLAISISVFQLFGGGEWFTNVVRPALLQNLAPGSGPQVAETLEEAITAVGSATSGGIGVVLLVLAVYGIFSGIESIFNGIWGVSGKMGGIGRLPLYWGLVTIVPTLTIGYFAISTYIQALPLVNEAVERVSGAKQILNAILPIIMIMLGFFLLYKFLPATRVRYRAAAIGAVFASLMHELLKTGFIFYTSTLVNYNVIYGSLAVLPILMIWINLSWIVVLAGVEVSFVIQHWRVLTSRRKHVHFSRDQQDSLAYLMLFEATGAFRGERPIVTIEEWTNYGVPPGAVNEMLDRFETGNLLLRTGKEGGSIILGKDPNSITLKEVDMIISGETSSEWNWPAEPAWDWIKLWMKERQENLHSSMKSATLEDLVEKIKKEAIPISLNKNRQAS